MSAIWDDALSCKFQGYKYVGFYLWNKPALFIRDPELIKVIWSKNFMNFHDTTWYISPHSDPYFAHTPFVEKGSAWKKLRHQLTPMLSPGKAKQLFPAIIESNTELVNYLKRHVNENNGKREEINLKDLTSQYTTECVAQSFYGVKSYAFENPNAELLHVGKLIFQTTTRISLETICMMCDRTLSKIFKAKAITKPAFDFFKNFTKQLIQYRKTNEIHRNDYFEHLLNVIKTDNEEEKTEDIARQLITVFFDGVDTAAGGFTIALFEIIKHPDAYQNIRKEIDRILENHGNQLSPEAIHDMTYLDACVSEAFRLNPPLYFSLRDCTSPIEFPMPKDDESKENEKLLIEPGVTMIIPMYQIHRDPKYHKNPEEFNPSRFMDKEKSSIQNYTYFPFSDGPRMCLGKNYAMAAIKPFIISIVKNFDVRFKPNTNYSLRPAVGLDFNAILFNENYWLDVFPRGTIYSD
ncbi:cytochrome P450 9e2-like [Chrysoperla carnea]|uniref:cytochrome P450 9e2-like n=1 Tax=Chrysoperla carnea TaxID=189513 RepID=UPI001D0853EE|nr:cytochrome P450 9e2-like [Chrysoperla carnea]